MDREEMFLGGRLNRFPWWKEVRKISTLKCQVTAGDRKSWRTCNVLKKSSAAWRQRSQTDRLIWNWGSIIQMTDLNAITWSLREDAQETNTGTTRHWTSDFWFQFCLWGAQRWISSFLLSTQQVKTLNKLKLTTLCRSIREVRSQGKSLFPKRRDRHKEWIITH